MRGLDFTSWRSLLATLVGLALVTLIGVGMRVLTMIAIQQRRERTNRQINERLRALIAAYKALGGSFTGDLTVDPRHMRDFAVEPATSDRARRIRDAVEAALSDIILLGTEEQVRLAARAAQALAAGQPVPTAELVVSLRDFIREALDLDPVPASVVIPRQGPARPSVAGSGKGGKEAGASGGGGGGGGGGLGGMGGGGMGGGGLATGGHRPDEDEDDDAHR